MSKFEKNKSSVSIEIIEEIKIIENSDTFTKARGGYTTLVLLKCKHCENILARYKKDGSIDGQYISKNGIKKPETLERCYGDRFEKQAPEGDIWNCSKCELEIGKGCYWTKNNENRWCYILSEYDENKNKKY
jgi:hypothetical protein